MDIILPSQHEHAANARITYPKHRVVKGHLLSAIFRERSKGKKGKTNKKEV